jgi:DNA polymerase-1
VIMLGGAERDARVMGEREVIEKYGIPPALLPEYFALMGDSSDNIPGVPGIGPKSAGALVKAYGDLETIYDHLESVTPPRVQRALAENRDAAFSSRRLVLIDRDVPDMPALDALAVGDVREGEIRALFTKLGFRRLLRQVLKPKAHTGPEPMVWPGGGGTSDMPTCEGRAAVDVNLTAGAAFTSGILGIALACEQGGNHYFPLAHGEPGNVSPQDLAGVLRGLFGDGSIGKVVHDAKSAVIALRRLGMDLQGIRSDTMLGAYLLNPGRSNLSAEDLAMEFLGRMLPGAGQSRDLLMTVRQASERCCQRARAILDAAPAIEDELEELGLMGLYRDLEMPLARVLADMECRGIRIDRPHLQGLADDLEQRLAMIEKEAYSVAGRQFNLNSPRDISRLLFDEIGLKPGRRTKTGYSTDLSVLVQLAGEHELPRRIVEFRQLSKLKSGHIDQLLRFADPQTDRIHASFNQTVTATGRLSSSDPNLQNVPIRTDMGGEIRRGFIPSRHDWILVSADYSQIELRVVAHLSGDQRLREAFEAGEDIHSRTAGFIFKVEPDRVDQQMRSIAKAVNFGIIYGMGHQSLARTTGLSSDDAARFLKEHRRTYPDVYDYADRLLENARQTGYVETVLGRKRYLPALASEQPGARAAAERMAINTPVQGTAADIIKLAMLKVAGRIEKLGLSGGIVVQVHDEILIDCPDSEGEQMGRILEDEMGGAFELEVPLKVEVRSGANWLEAH